MDWSFLDEMDKNLLYSYALGLDSDISKVRFHTFFTPSTEEGDNTEYIIAESKLKSAYYIIWFVFRYVLNCATFEEAKKNATEEILKKYKLISFFHKRRIYIGLYGVNEIYLYKYDEGDLEIVLEILYNRYDFFEQLDCFIRRTEGTARKTRSRCIKVKKQCIEMMKDKPEYKDILKKVDKNE